MLKAYGAVLSNQSNFKFVFVKVWKPLSKLYLLCEATNQKLGYGYFRGEKEGPR